MEKLTRFAFREAEGRSFVLTVEGEGGETLELAVSAEQMDVIAEAIDDALDRDDASAFAADEGPTYQKPLG